MTSSPSNGFSNPLNSQLLKILSRGFENLFSFSKPLDSFSKIRSSFSRTSTGFSKGQTKGGTKK
jgi:hypothetical protein